MGHGGAVLHNGARFLVFYKHGEASEIIPIGGLVSTYSINSATYCLPYLRQSYLQSKEPRELLFVNPQQYPAATAPSLT